MPPGFREHGLATFFDDIVFSCEVGIAKPAPEIYQIACDRLGARAKDCVFLGDGGSDELSGALQVEMEPILLWVDREIRDEGISPEVANWKGPIIERLSDVRNFL